MTTDTAPHAAPERPDVAAALMALLASPLGALLDALLPAGVLSEIGAVLDRAIAADAVARQEAAETRRALVAEAAADKARADAAVARVAVVEAETLRLRSSLAAAETQIANLTQRLGHVRQALSDVAGAVATATAIVHGADAAGPAPRVATDRAAAAGAATSDLPTQDHASIPPGQGADASTDLRGRGEDLRHGKQRTRTGEPAPMAARRMPPAGAAVSPG